MSGKNIAVSTPAAKAATKQIIEEDPPLKLLFMPYHPFNRFYSNIWKNQKMVKLK